MESARSIDDIVFSVNKRETFPVLHYTESPGRVNLKWCHLLRYIIPEQ